MTTRKRIVIGVKDSQVAAAEFVRAWKQAAGGKRNGTVERLYFEDLASLLKVLTPRRLATLRTLGRQGPMSVRALARAMGRDYKNAFNDVRALEQAGLLARSKTGMPMVPWRKIVAELDTAA
jgi:predicted transcriptional regulator